MANTKTTNRAISQEDMMKLLDDLYAKALTGIPKVGASVSETANDYLTKNSSVEEAAKEFTKYQLAKCTTSGFLTGLGGLATLPIAIPANISSVMYVQIRMIACLAYMGGYDVNSDQVQTLIYACLAGISVDHIVKMAGVKIGEKFAMAMVKKIPGAVLTKINQKVGFRLITKFGTKGIINLGKMVPIVGGFISGGFDYAETKIIARRAYLMFIKGNFYSENISSTAADEFTDVDLVEATE